MSKSFSALYQRAYRKDNPERCKRWELKTAQNKLEKAGYKVKPPQKKEKLEQMTDDELQAEIEKQRERNRENCAKYRQKHREQFNQYQAAYNRNRIKITDLKAELDRRHGNGE